VSLLQSTHEHITDAVKAAPPLAVTASTFVGMSLQDWVYALTIIYTVLQIALLVRKHFKDKKDGS
jgi:disulfide bond formation protein DsbB